jgi:hypothetical protein
MMMDVSFAKWYGCGSGVGGLGYFHTRINLINTSIALPRADQPTD